jgi:thioredoxin
METILTDENFEKEINGAKELVLVDFFATWCEPCTMLAPTLEKVAGSFKDKVILMKANLDNNPLSAQKFGVEKIPTVIVFKNGKPVSGFVGLVPEKSIKEWLENILKEHGK